jgi:hypothetical protein
MIGVGGHDELPLPHTQQIVLAQDPVNPLGVHGPAAPAQFRRDARSAVAGPLQRNPLDGVAQVHIRIRTWLGVVLEAVEAGPADPAQLHHALNC